MREVDLVGKQFGMLTVKRMLPKSLCACDCECGKTNHVTARYSVAHGLARSCGCRQFGNHVTHGESRSAAVTPEYRAWVNMNNRCHNPNATRFRTWGGRGITVYPPWRKDFGAFLGYVGRRPASDYSLDRYPDPDGNYEPGNVRWATREQQARNRSNRQWN